MTLSMGMAQDAVGFFAEIAEMYTHFPLQFMLTFFIFPILVSFSIANLKYSKNCESAYKTIEIGFTLCTCGVYFL